MTAVVADPADSRARARRSPVACEAPDDELLLADWLNALIYEMATRTDAVRPLRGAIDGHAAARGQAWGERVDVARHQPAVEVKGATYTALRVARDRRRLGGAVRGGRLSHGPSISLQPALRLRVGDRPAGRDARAGA